MDWKNFWDYQKKTVAIIFIIITLGSLAWMLLTPETYKATATIIVEKREPDIEKIDQLSQQSSAEIYNTIYRLQSTSLIIETLKKLKMNVYSDSPEVMSVQHHLFVKNLRSSNVIEVNLIYPNAAQAALIVNTLIDTMKTNSLKEQSQKLNQALASIKTSLTQIQVQERQIIQDTASKYVNASFTQYINDIDIDIRNTSQRIEKIKKSVSANQILAIEKSLTAQNMEPYKPEIQKYENIIVPLVLEKGWKVPPVENQMQQLWIEKTKMCGLLKNAIAKTMNIASIQSLDDWIAFRVRIFDLELRKAILESYRPTPNPVTPAPGDKEQQIRYLQEMESRFLKKEMELQNLVDFPLSDISWVDRATPPVKPVFHPDIFTAAGLSLALGAIIALSLGLFFYETRRSG